MTPQAPQGWYHAHGDPHGTVRYWDGTLWVGKPTIGTAENPPPAPTPLGGGPTVHGRELASPGDRVAAAFLDAILNVAVGWIVTVAAVVAGWHIEHRGSRLLLLVSTTLIGLNAAYYVISTTVWGATPGKKMLGIQVIRSKDGVGPPGLRAALLRFSPTLIAGGISIAVSARTQLPRNIAGVIPYLVLLTSLGLVLRDKLLRRSLSDRVGQTYVVKGRSGPASDTHVVPDSHEDVDKTGTMTPQAPQGWYYAQARGFPLPDRRRRKPSVVSRRCSPSSRSCSLSATTRGDAPLPTGWAEPTWWRAAVSHLRLDGREHGIGKAVV
jgi:uncharacterized RDD family membrane protein YckC